MFSFFKNVKMPSPPEEMLKTHLVHFETSIDSEIISGAYEPRFKLYALGTANGYLYIINDKNITFRSPKSVNYPLLKILSLPNSSSFFSICSKTMFENHTSRCEKPNPHNLATLNSIKSSKIQNICTHWIINSDRILSRTVPLEFDVVDIALSPVHPEFALLLTKEGSIYGFSIEALNLTNLYINVFENKPVKSICWSSGYRFLVAHEIVEGIDVQKLEIGTQLNVRAKTVDSIENFTSVIDHKGIPNLLMYTGVVSTLNVPSGYSAVFSGMLNGSNWLSILRSENGDELFENKNRKILLKNEHVMTQPMINYEKPFERGQPKSVAFCTDFGRFVFLDGKVVDHFFYEVPEIEFAMEDFEDIFVFAVDKDAKVPENEIEKWKKEEMKWKKDEEKRKKNEEEARRKQQEELRKKQEEEEKKKKEEEEKKKKEEEEEEAKRKQEEEDKKKQEDNDNDNDDKTSKEEEEKKEKESNDENKNEEDKVENQTKDEDNEKDKETDSKNDEDNKKGEDKKESNDEDTKKDSKEDDKKSKKDEDTKKDTKDDDDKTETKSKDSDTKQDDKKSKKDSDAKKDTKEDDKKSKKDSDTKQDDKKSNKNTDDQNDTITPTCYTVLRFTHGILHDRFPLNSLQITTHPLGISHGKILFVEHEHDVCTYDIRTHHKTVIQTLDTLINIRSTKRRFPDFILSDGTVLKCKGTDDGYELFEGDQKCPSNNITDWRLFKDSMVYITSENRLVYKESTKKILKSDTERIVAFEVVNYVGRTPKEGDEEFVVIVSSSRVLVLDFDEKEKKLRKIRKVKYSPIINASFTKIGTLIVHTENEVLMLPLPDISASIIDKTPISKNGKAAIVHKMGWVLFEPNLMSLHIDGLQVPNIYDMNNSPVIETPKVNKFLKLFGKKEDTIKDADDAFQYNRSSAVMARISETQEVMQQLLVKANERGELLNEMEIKSNRLLTSAQKFHQLARDLKNRPWFL